MAYWVTHLMIADRILQETEGLDRRGFCVGNIAPDCNMKNEDGISYTPSRETTHWMSGKRKALSDCERFYEEYIVRRGGEIRSEEQYAFLLGYYTHLITDAAWKEYTWDERRVKAVWDRIKADTYLREKTKGYPESWDSIKRLAAENILAKDRYRNEIHSIEAEYLKEHPDSGYLTEIIPLKEFPDYVDYLPPGSIIRKIGIMGKIPEADEKIGDLLILSKEEHTLFVENTTRLFLQKIREKALLGERNRFVGFIQ